MRGVTIGNKHSYTNFGLYLKKYPVIEPPKPRIVTVDIPGGNGSIDLTECLTGDVMYQTRKITMEFLVMDARNQWPTKYSNILDYMHGKRMKIQFDNDPSYYYMGRITVNEWSADKKTSVITIEAECDPYKYETTLHTMTESISGGGGFGVQGIVMPVVPEFVTTAAMTLTFNGKTYALSEGSNTIPDIVLRKGTNFVDVTGNGTITMNYRGGRL